MGSARRKTAAPRLPASVKRMQKTVQKMAGAAGVEIRTDLPQQVDLERLAILLDAEVGEGSTLLEYRAALNVIAVAWNVSLMPQTGRRKRFRGRLFFRPAAMMA